MRLLAPAAIWGVSLSCADAFLHPPASQQNISEAEPARFLSTAARSLDDRFHFRLSAGKANISSPEEGDQSTHDESNPPEHEKDTIRVRLWRALASGNELSLTQLSKRVGEKRGDVKAHLTHVERQAKTLGNKSDVWRARRGLQPVAKREDGSGSGGGPKKLRLKTRRGAKNEVFFRLV
ncbi:hypothetical protein ACHAXT_000947 [Thalassiosira profunda]